MASSVKEVTIKRIMERALTIVSQEAKERIRVSANNVLQFIDRKAKTELGMEIFEAIGSPNRPAQWTSVNWKPLSEAWQDYKTIKMGSSPFANSFFYYTGELNSLPDEFPTGRIFGRSYVKVNGVKPKNRADWSNIKLPFRAKRDGRIEAKPSVITFHPFNKLHRVPVRNRRFARQAFLKAFGQQAAYKFAGPSDKYYRPVLEPALLTLLTGRSDLRQEIIDRIVKRGL